MIVDVISLILTKVKTEALKKIRNYDSNINDKDIKWVVTVPAIWSDINKQIMIEASLNAGLIQKDSEQSLFLAYEPEAAAYYCQYDGIPIPENKPYIVCDLGGGTADIVCHMKIKRNNQVRIREVHRPVGGPYGSNEINKEIIKKVIKPLFGEDTYKKTLESSTGEDYKDLFDFESNIQYFKESLSLKFNGIFRRKKIEDSKITEFADSEEYTLENFINDLREQCKEEGPYKLDCTLFKFFTNSSLEELTNNFNNNNNLNLIPEVNRKREEILKIQKL
jgi:molecular chaperone DnaK (HSP70)